MQLPTVLERTAWSGAMNGGTALPGWLLGLIHAG